MITTSAPEGNYTPLGAGTTTFGQSNTQPLVILTQPPVMPILPGGYSPISFTNAFTSVPMVTMTAIPVTITSPPPETMSKNLWIGLIVSGCVVVLIIVVLLIVKFGLKLF